MPERPSATGSVGAVIAAAATGGVAACDAARGSAGAEASFTVAVLPDTQYYVASHPEIFEAQTRWIAGARDGGGIALVVHIAVTTYSPYLNRFKTDPDNQFELEY